jgi:predicted glutamine amidotransferase
MCRLLSYCTQGSAPVAETVGEHGLADFTGLAAYHSQGWGMAWYADGSADAQARKSPLAALGDPGYDALAHSVLGDLGLIHLRRATPGLPVRAANSHPFRYGGYAMAHNGAVHPVERLGGLLTPEWERRLTGDTDSERYFLHVMARAEELGGDMVAALAGSAAEIEREFTASSLNAIFLSPTELYAICWYDPAGIPAGAAAQQGYHGPAERYFDLAYRRVRGAVVVASTGWQQPGWSTLPNRHVLVVDRGTLRTRVVPLRPLQPVGIACEAGFR